MPAAVPPVLSASLSAQGYVRPNNEDRVYCDDARGIYFVVDGMGGHAAGEQAASIAVERLRARLERPGDNPEQRLREAIALANNAIHEAAQTTPAWLGMACVLTVALVENGEVTVGHVGDSRLYQIRQGVIRKLTRDHSPVGEREDAGEISEKEAMLHPRRNEVYRDVGSEEHAPDDPDFVDTFRFALEPDSAVLLCSDGLSDALPSEQILRMVEENATDPQSVVRVLVAAATRVGHDNVSVVLIEGEAFAKSGLAVRAARPTDTDSDAERTDRLAHTGGPGARVHWYNSRPAYFVYGTTLGAVLALAVIHFFVRPFGVRQVRTIHVSAPMTIAQALESAVAGDTVVLGPGTYAEVVHLKNGVNVRAERRRMAVIEGSVIAEDGTHARLEGVQIHAADFGIVVQDSEVTLLDNEVSGAHDMGVEFLGGSHGAVVNCEIHDNAGAGIAVLDTAEAAIRNNVITGNGTATGRLRPGLLIRSTGNVTVSGNIFAGNGSEAVWLPVENPRLLRTNAFAFGAAKEEKRPVFKIVAREESQP